MRHVGIYTGTYTWSDNGRNQFENRNTSSLTPNEALKKSGSVEERPEVVSRGLSYNADELRVFAPVEAQNLLFVIKESVVVTVLRAKSYRIDPVSLHRCNQCSNITDLVVVNGCPHCSESVRQVQEV